MKKGSIRDVASRDLDLHQFTEPIAARYRDASHARREVKLHRPLCGCSPTKSTLAHDNKAPSPKRSNKSINDTVHDGVKTQSISDPTPHHPNAPEPVIGFGKEGFGSDRVFPNLGRAGI